jgi:hypothetical protein
MMVAMDCAAPADAEIDDFRLEARPPGLLKEAELAGRVQSRTNRQVRDLRIRCCGNHVTLTGFSRTYYAKQLATQAVLSAHPQVELANEIAVCSAQSKRATAVLR